MRARKPLLVLGDVSREGRFDLDVVQSHNSMFEIRSGPKQMGQRSCKQMNDVSMKARK